MEQVWGVSPSGMCSGASWIRTICLSENLDRLCTSCIACFAWQDVLPHTWGSAISPREMKTSCEVLQTVHSKKAMYRSGMTELVRVTMPLIETSLLMSLGSRSRRRSSRPRLKHRTVNRFPPSSSPSVPGWSLR